MMTTVAALADTKFYIPDFSIAPGGTVEVEMMLDNTDELSAIQADIYLPEGLTIEQEDGEYIFDLTDRKARNHTVSSTLLSDGGIRILVSSQTSKTFSGNSGALVVFNLTAAEGLAGGDRVIALKNIIASDADSHLTYPADASCTVTVTGEAPGPDPDPDPDPEPDPDPDSDGDRLYISNFSIAPGETVEVRMTLDNETAYTALQADIYLPDGLAIEQEDGEYLFDLTDRKARNHTVSSTRLSDGGIRILVASQTSKEFSGNSGALVTFNLIADETLTGPLTITIKNIIASEPNQTIHNLADASCAVTVTDPTPQPKPVEALMTVACELPQGIKFRFNVQAKPDDADNKAIAWSSSDTAVATVADDGTIELVTEGDVTITATAADGSGAAIAYAIHVTEAQQTGNRYDVNGDTLVDVGDVNAVLSFILAH